GWELLMRHDGPVGGYELHFLAPLQHLSPDITLTYGRSLIEFTPRITSVGQAIGFSASFWISAIKTQVTASIGWDWDRQSFDVNISFGFGLPSWVDTTPEAAAAAVRRERADRESGEPATPEQQREFDAETDQLAEKERQGVQRQIDRDNAQTRFTLVDEPVTPETVARVLVGKLLPKLNSRLTGSGSTVGDLRIKPGGVIKFEGLGAQFSGLYRVVSATHTIDGGGYRTSFDVRKEIWFGSIPPYDQGMVPVRLMGQRLGA
ncbi:MAG TPA: hypothetical protein VGJ87_12945, partial [Roseiflexaceae bacterium]